jgi:ABC-type sugar transport system substrate-binding protein
MSDLRTAAKQALEALEAGPDVDPIFAGETEVALRAALAQPEQWNGLTDSERDYFKAFGFVGVSRVEEVLRAKNSIPSTKRTVTYVCPVCAASLERQE